MPITRWNSVLEGRRVDRRQAQHDVGVPAQALGQVAEPLAGDDRREVARGDVERQPLDLQRRGG